jgi:hypothetical protein
MEETTPFFPSIMGNSCMNLLKALNFYPAKIWDMLFRHRPSRKLFWLLWNMPINKKCEKSLIKGGLNAQVQGLPMGPENSKHFGK